MILSNSGMLKIYCLLLNQWHSKYTLSKQTHLPQDHNIIANKFNIITKQHTSNITISEYVIINNPSSIFKKIKLNIMYYTLTH